MYITLHARLWLRERIVQNTTMHAALIGLPERALHGHKYFQTSRKRLNKNVKEPFYTVVYLQITFFNDYVIGS